MELDELLAFVPIGWTESFEDFASYLAHIGVRLEPRPRFQPGDCVTVACSPGVIALREGTTEDIERTLELEELNAFEVRSEGLDSWTFYVLSHKTKSSAIFRQKENEK